MDISNRVGAMQFSPIRRFNTFAFEAEAEGKTENEKRGRRGVRS